MTSRTNRRRTPGVVAATLLLVAVAALAAAASDVLLTRPAAVARGGQVQMELAPPDPPQSTGAAQPALATVPIGPHLRVPILYYHYIRTIVPNPRNLESFRLSISPSLFAEQMALLHVEGAHTITLETLMAALQGKAALPAHPVVLTFDDGYSDFATAAVPILEQYGFIATDFVVSGFVNRFHYMSATQVRAVAAAGMVVGAHTMHHLNLTAVPPTVAQNEIVGSRAALQSLLGQPVLDFAYPYGAYDAAVVRMVQQAGFRDAASTMWGTTQSLDQRFLLRRLEVGGAPSLGTFAGDCQLPAPSAAQLVLIYALALRAPSATSA